MSIKAQPLLMTIGVVALSGLVMLFASSQFDLEGAHLIVVGVCVLLTFAAIAAVLSSTRLWLHEGTHDADFDAKRDNQPGVEQPPHQ